MSDRTRRAVATMGAAVLVAAACGLLGAWQWNRHLARSASVAIVLANYDAAPVPLAEVLTAQGPVAADQVWRPVRATGGYLADATVLLRNRPVDGQRGFHVLTPFLVSDGDLAGSVLVVDRGWLPATGPAAETPEVPSPPSGEVALVVRLRADEPLVDRDAPAGQVQSIAVDAVRAAAPVAWSAPTLSGYGQAVTEDGERPDLGPLERPRTDLGPHLSYAFQWWVFAAGALVGGVILIRRDDTWHPRRRLGSAELEEDALLDAQEAAGRG